MRIGMPDSYQAYRPIRSMETNETNDLPTKTQDKVIIILAAITIAIWIAVIVFGVWIYNMEFKP